MNKHKCWNCVFAFLALGAFAVRGNAEEPVMVLSPPGMHGVFSSAASSVTLIDPELSSAVAKPPVQPPEPPQQVRLPNLVIKRDEWRGVQCGVTEDRFAVFRHADKWQSFWERGLAPYSSKLAKVPSVDFTKDMVIGIFLGELPDPHYEVEIRSMKVESREGRPTLVVRYRVIQHMTGVFNPPFAVQPFDLRKTPAFEGLVLFQRVRR